MKIKFALLLLSIFTFSCGEKDYLVTISTEFGEMKLILFDETPKHKSTFIEFAKAGKYDSTTFHRVISSFMIQGGDVNQRITGDRDNTLIDAEFRPNLIHTKGMLAGARSNNPEKRSGVQFYIVHGTTYSAENLKKQYEENYYGNQVRLLNQLFKQGKHKDILAELIQLQSANDVDGVKNKVYSCKGIIEDEFGPQIKREYTEEQYTLYETEGGAPHLDGEYTVYGKVVEGLDVIDLIAAQEVGAGDIPTSDIYMTVTVEEVSKKKLSKLYGIEYTK
jgi:peptidyl-prolyl cis-trans isomerase B (cyclophilin B)